LCRKVGKPSTSFFQSLAIGDHHLEAFETAEDFLAGVVRIVARIGEEDAFTDLFEWRHAADIGELFDLHRDGRLRQAEFLRGAGKA